MIPIAAMFKGMMAKFVHAPSNAAEAGHSLAGVHSDALAKASEAAATVTVLDVGSELIAPGKKGGSPVRQV